MPYRHIIDHCLASEIGAGGLAEEHLAATVKEAEGAIATLSRQRQEGTLPLLALPHRDDDIAALTPVAARFRDQFSDVVILGTGGSSLGGQSLAALAGIGLGPAPGAPKLHFMDNIDPHTFTLLLERLDLSRAGFLVISKSGGTAETLCQFLVCLKAWRRALPNGVPGEHFLAITEPKDSALRRFAEALDLPVIDHDPGIGGRFSALSLVGVLPAMIAGIDALPLRQGAAAVLDRCLDPAGVSGEAPPPALGAAVNIALNRQHGVGTTVLMPYIDRLRYFGLWYRQLWAESLGKDGQGTTPIRAMGTVDQHSQLQLYLDGPRDKLFTLITLDVAGKGEVMEAGLAGSGEDLVPDYLAGRRMGDLLDAEQRATAATLARRGCPVRLIALDGLGPYEMGALMMHFMLETIIAAHLLEVDPFDQPAVEEGKVLARDYLAAMTKERGAVS